MSENPNKKIRVRMAPSPTGYMHIGNFRTALYNYLFAKKTGGDFILRIEDTDQKRFVEGALESLLQTMEWAGLSYGEGVFSDKSKCQNPNVKCIGSDTYPGIIEVGDSGPYIQSERLELYKKYAEQLVKDGKAYYCFCEPGRLEEMREKQQKEKRPPMYDRYCLTGVSAEQINEKLQQKCPGTIRLKVPRNEKIVFDDLVRGRIEFSTNTIDDQVLLKSDGFPTYHLANVVDDHLMGITHVIRGEEWLPSTPKHVLLYHAFGWEIPSFAHLPLLLNPDKTKLSKRQGDVAVEDYIAKGYIKEAIINFVALLGWNPGEGSVQEIFSIEELIEKFDLHHVHKAGAVFDLKKLDWINNKYIKKLSIDELYAQALPYFQKKDWFESWSMKHETYGTENQEQYIKKVLTVEQERLNTLAQVGDENPYFFEEITYEKSMLIWKSLTFDDIKISLETSRKTLDEIDEAAWTRENIETILLGVAGDKRGDLLWPLRVALTGAQKSPSPFEVAWVLGKQQSLKRIDAAIAQL